MPKKGQKTARDFRHHWFAKEWLEYYGKRQADLVRDLGWPRAKASDIWNGQPYRQELVDDLLPYLNLRPYEILMDPDLAMSFRRVKSLAVHIATETNNAEPEITSKPMKASDAA